MSRILTNLYGVRRTRPSRKPLKEWLENEIKATEKEIASTRYRAIGRQPYGQYLIEKAEKKLARLRQELQQLENKSVNAQAEDRL